MIEGPTTACAICGGPTGPISTERLRCSKRAHELVGDVAIQLLGEHVTALTWSAVDTLRDRAAISRWMAGNSQSSAVQLPDPDIDEADALQLAEFARRMEASSV